tara:strand:- start:304 stop:831 length:528 start_codon:yes stop_codon:yes gene_type:complete
MSQIKVDSIVPRGGLPSGASGGIIQIVQTVKTSSFSKANNASFSAITGLTVTITPQSSSNKILIIPSVAMTAQSGHRHGFRIVRGSTPIFIGDSSGSNQRVTCFMGNPPNDAVSYRHTFLGLDEPATTSATTYSLEIKGEGNGSTDIFINRSSSSNTGGDFFRGCSTITAMEVGM